VFDGKRLDDDFTLSYYNILDNSTILLYQLMPCEEPPVEELEDNKTLADYNIRNNSYIYQITKASCGRNIKVNIRRLIGESIKLTINTSDPIGVLKTKIFDKIAGIVDSIQVLFSLLYNEFK